MNPGKSNRPVIMGILNVTPDSFSDGGQYTDTRIAIKHAAMMVEEGADIIDVGGESTRPGSQRVNAAEQRARVMGIIRELHEILPGNVPVSIDTTLSEVAKAAIEAGASIINDISAGRDDPGIMKVAADAACPYIIMHMQGTPGTMQDNPEYDNVVREVLDFLLDRAAEAEKNDIERRNIIIDPGIGFGKTTLHNLELLANLDQFVKTGYPVLLGTSRKRFMGAVCRDKAAQELIGATCATTTLGVNAGVRYFRVHDVQENRQAADVAWAVKAESTD
ncbi:MAG TPA: dihydropteroate synthase [Gammaproteobacteria bacterium]|nr:dihydropteroate synthase [Gammaproteobacteria bacterium]